MRSTFAVLALAGSVAAQAVTELITPASPPPQGCGVTRQGQFQITIVNITQDATTPSAGAAASPSAAPAKRDIVARQDTSNSALEVTLTNGVLKDAKNRTGYIAENFQFQFDGPPQAGAIYTGGFSLCSNGSIALGGSAVWWQCLSGTFFNLYDRKWAEHCVPCYFEAIGGGGNIDMSAKPVIATATVPPPSASSAASANGTESNSTETSSSSSATSTSGSGSSGSGSGSSSGSQSSAPPAGNDAAQLIPSVLSVLSLAAVICFNGLY